MWKGLPGSVNGPPANTARYWMPQKLIRPGSHGKGHKVSTAIRASMHLKAIWTHRCPTAVSKWSRQRNHVARIKRLRASSGSTTSVRMSACCSLRISAIAIWTSSVDGRIVRDVANRKWVHCCRSTPIRRSARIFEKFGRRRSGPGRRSVLWTGGATTAVTGNGLEINHTS